LYPSPVVTAVSPVKPPAGGGTTVTVSGQYFTGTIKVLVGGISSAFTVMDDSTIQVIAPGGTKGKTEDIVVTTGGGSSFQTAADQITYK
ncbi:MAG: IPT/TIG domain-containing protein, partial [Candidatus Limnocylindrales bacterium]